ncbi:MAG: hypothetical protein K2P14_03680 [Anaeroplasmataceae bacterium]|nr:hypothetical protein [Anaeroplasmataceae bacterium]
MLAYNCKNCKKVTILGYRNEFNEHFCDERCYLEYCEKHHYMPHLDRLKQIKNPLTD